MKLKTPYAFMLPWLLLLFGFTSAASSSASYDINNCITKSGRVPNSISRLTCHDIKSLSGLEQLTKSRSLTLVHSHSSNDAIMNVSAAKSESVSTLVLTNNGWSSQDIQALADALPNVSRIVCRLCGVFTLSEFGQFASLREINVELLPVVYGRWHGGLEPAQAIIFGGLNYDQMDSVTVSASPSTQISCRDLGQWSKKVMTHFAGTSSYPRPYKIMSTCFPYLDQISSLIQEGDKLYQLGQVKRAHRLYLEAFELNPYDQHAVSNLSLTYYRLGEYCRSAQVAASGEALINGIPATRAAIHYNSFLALKALGDPVAAKEALMRSHEVRPSASKVQQLTELEEEGGNKQTCNFDRNWIHELYSDIELQAVKRSRGQPKPYADLDLSDFTIVQTVKGYQTYDMLNIVFEKVAFEIGMYGIILQSAPGVNLSTQRRQVGMSCDAARRGVSSRNSFAHVLDDYFVPLEDDPNGWKVEVVKVFEIKKTDINDYCSFGGDAWWMETGEYVFQLVRFNT